MRKEVARMRKRARIFIRTLLVCFGRILAHSAMGGMFLVATSVPAQETMEHGVAEVQATLQQAAADAAPTSAAEKGKYSGVTTMQEELAKSGVVVRTVTVRAEGVAKNVEPKLTDAKIRNSNEKENGGIVGQDRMTGPISRFQQTVMTVTVWKNLATSESVEQLRWEFDKLETWMNERVGLQDQLILGIDRNISWNFNMLHFLLASVGIFAGAFAFRVVSTTKSQASRAILDARRQAMTQSKKIAKEVASKITREFLAQKNTEFDKHAGEMKQHVGAAEKMVEDMKKQNAMFAQSTESGDQNAGKQDVRPDRKNNIKKQMFIAARENNVEKIAQLIQEGADVNQADQLGKTPLFLAAANNATDAVAYLIKCNADVNVKDNRGFTPIFYAAVHNNSAVVDELITHKADVNIYGELENGMKITPIYMAVSMNCADVLSVLITKGQADVNASYAGGVTLLHAAVGLDQIPVLSELVKYNINIDAADENGMTALHLAAGLDKVVAASILMEHGALVNVQDCDGETPLHGAARKGNVNIIYKLMEHKADVNIQDKDGHSPLYAPAFEDMQKVAEVLIDNKANVNIKDKKGRTPLDFALEYESYTVASVLKEHGGKQGSTRPVAVAEEGA